MTPTERRQAALREVEACVCRDRQNAYGDAEDSFADIAAVWSIQLGGRLTGPLTAVDVALLMAGLKLCRLKGNPTHRDSLIDLAGYGICGAGIVANGEPARS